MSHQMSRNSPLLRTIAMYKAYLSGQVTADEGFQRLIYAELEPKERIVLHSVQVHPDSSAADIVAREAIGHVQTATMLKRLFDLGLITRREQVDGNGRYFIYRPSEWTRLLSKDY